MTIHLYKDDLPDGLDMGAVVAIDCEAMGLHPHRDRLCVVQLSGGDGNAHLVQVSLPIKTCAKPVSPAGRPGGDETVSFRALRHCASGA